VVSQMEAGKAGRLGVDLMRVIGEYGKVAGGVEVWVALGCGA